MALLTAVNLHRVATLPTMLPLFQAPSVCQLHTIPQPPHAFNLGTASVDPHKCQACQLKERKRKRGREALID